MRKKFVVMHDAMDEDAQKQFVAWINDQKFGWWHWINGSWLVIDWGGTSNPATFRDFLTETLNLKRALVLEVSDDNENWSGFGPSKEPKNMFTWLRDIWFKK